MMRQYTTGVKAAQASVLEAQKHEEEMVDLFIEMLPESFVQILERRLYAKKQGAQNTYNNLSGLGGIFGGASQALLPTPPPPTYYQLNSHPAAVVTPLAGPLTTAVLGTTNTSTYLLDYVYGLFK